MDLTAWLLRHTPPRPLVVTLPGGTESRLAVERETRERGWLPANSPAEANMLIVAGPTTSTAEPYIEQVWQQLPAPRTRANIPTPTTAKPTLDTAATTLRNTPHQRRESRTQPPRVPRSDTPSCGFVPTSQGQGAHADHSGHHTVGHSGHHTVGHSEHDKPSHSGHHTVGHSEHDKPSHSGHHTVGHSGHDMADHSSHVMAGHSGHDMAGTAMPGDIPMADRAEDRDGLMLDHLHLPLGPLLPDWPAGLIVRTTLQGDVIQHATVETLPSHPHPFWHETPAAALDSCARLLSVAGWADAATTARRLRDAALLGNTEQVATWAKRVRRSRTLRWLLTDVGTTPNNPTTPPELRGDALARLHRWLELPPRTDSTQWTLDNLPALLEGTELATARLIVASLDPDLDHG